MVIRVNADCDRDKWRDSRAEVVAKIEENIGKFNVQREAPKVIDDSAPLDSISLQSSSIPAQSKSQPPSTTPSPAAAEQSKEVSNVLKSIQDLLNGCEFAESPPFTGQRLAELILNPLKYHSHSIKYLRAVERCVNVTTTMQDYPPVEGEAASVGDVETKGPGTALYSPIPWLIPENTPTAEESGVSQGELLVQEQEMQSVKPNEDEILPVHSPAAGVLPVDAVDIGPTN